MFFLIVEELLKKLFFTILQILVNVISVYLKIVFIFDERLLRI
jgi:hypothetical protein